MPYSAFRRQGGRVKARKQTQVRSQWYSNAIKLSMGSNLANSNIRFLRTALVQFGRRGGMEMKMKEKPMPQLKKNSSTPDKMFPVNI